MIQWNCRSLRTNFTDLDILLKEFSPAVVCLQETFQSDNNIVKFRHYTQYFKNSTKQDGTPSGGVAVLARNSVPQSPIITNSTLQAAAVRITLHRPFTICTLYLPPNAPVSLYDLTDLLHQLPPPVVLMGDFNAHSPLWGNGSLDNKGKIVEDFAAVANLCILNNKSPTYIHPATGSKTSIDLTITDPSLVLDFSWSVYDDLLGSDHFPIILKSSGHRSEPTFQRWKLHKGDWGSFRDHCEKELTINNLSQLPNSITTFTKQLLDIADKTIPKTNPNSCRMRKPWFTDECRKVVANRKRALHAFSQNATMQNLNQFKIARAIARKTIRTAKRQSWQAYVSNLNSNTSSKKVWDMIRKISGKSCHQPIKHLQINNTLITGASDIANALANKFSENSSTQHYSTNFKQHKAAAEKRTINFSSDNLEDYNLPFSTTELTDAICCAVDSSPGPDNVHYQFLKHLPHTSLSLLLSMLNSIWVNGVFPAAWHEATVVAIPKPDKDHSDPVNYRPIALTSCLCKTIERMVNNRLTHYLETNNIISNIQSGFRKQRCTTDQLLKLESYIRDGMANGQHVVAVFFDLEKAYDTTWKYGILADLHSAGLRGRLPTFISNFLSNRTFKVRLGSTLSDLSCQETGVPQGCILSVTLFALKINSITRCITPGIDASLYVDDFMACARSKQMRSVERQLQLCINNLQQWADENGFKFSKTKTVCVHFCNKRKLHPDPSLCLYNAPIPVVTQTKFLGMIFDNKLSFVPHLQNLRTKCNKAMNILKVVSHRDWGGDSQTLLKLYRSLIRSKLDYGCIAYNSARISYLSMLEPIQNHALRLCLGAFRTSPVESLQVEANEPPLEFRRNKLSLQYLVKLKSNASNPNSHIAFEPQFSELYDQKQHLIQPFGLRMRKVVFESRLDLSVIAHRQLASMSPWTLKSPKISFVLHTENKTVANPTVMKMEFDCYLSEHLDSTHIYTDGSKTNAGVAAAAICDGRLFVCRLPSEASIFSAEAKALTFALEIIRDTNQKKFMVFTDSMSCLQAILNRKLENPFILEIVEKCHALVTMKKEITFCWIPSHVGIVGNEKADKAAKMALQLDVSGNVKLPYTDLKQSITKHFTKIWQEKWSQTPLNKLRSIKPLLGLTKLGNHVNRRDETVLYRARIGHTYLTHSFLLKRENAPECNACHCTQTVQHVLIDCPYYAPVRSKHFTVNSLQELFQNVQIKTIVNFLKEVNLYDKF